jgi:glucose-6-phosphate isomerase
MEAERQGTEVALLEAGRPVCNLELCKLDAFHVGQYFMFMEVATAYAGGLMGIDPFDQPGVEAGKIAALSLMGCKGYDDRAIEIRQHLESRIPFRLSC